MKVFAFDEFLGAVDRVEYAEVEVLGGTFRIGSITPNDLDYWNELRGTPDGKRVSGPVLISRSMVDAEGKRIGVVTPYDKMTDEEKGKLARLQAMNLKASEKILTAIFKLNGIGRVAELDAKNV